MAKPATTVIDIITSFCKRKGIPAPSSVVGVDAIAEAQYLELFIMVGNRLLLMPYDWVQLKRYYTFNTVQGQTFYQLPGDYFKPLRGTIYNNTQMREMMGPLSDAEYSEETLGITPSSDGRYGYRPYGAQGYQYGSAQISAGGFQISPPPSSTTEALSLEHQSSSWVWPRNWETGVGYTIGNLRTGINNIYRATTNNTSGPTRPSWLTGSGQDGSPGVLWTVSNEAYEISHDEDICLFDKEIMVEGMRLEFYKEKLTNPEQEWMNWENQVAMAASRAAGPSRGNQGMSRSDRLPIINVPSSGWNV